MQKSLGIADDAVAYTDGESLLELLVEEQRSSVIFVADYVQLDFNGPVLSCFVWPRIETDGSKHMFPGTGYRDALCRLIAREVTAVTDTHDDGLVLRFGADRLVFKPDLEELRGPEIAMLRMGGSDRRWNVWRPGEGSFVDI